MLGCLEKLSGTYTWFARARVADCHDFADEAVGLCWLGHGGSIDSSSARGKWGGCFQDFGSSNYESGYFEFSPQQAIPGHKLVKVTALHEARYHSSCSRVVALGWT